MYAQAPENEFAADVRAGLMRGGRKTLPCRYFYDDVGSALFEAIACLPEYGLTRADARLIDRHARELAARLPARLAVAELGSGSGVKTRAILEALGSVRRPAYHPIDVSRAALLRCERELGALAEVAPIEGSYLEGLRQVTEWRGQGASLLVLFLGSTIGNFEPEAAAEFLRAVRRLLAPGDAFLLGADLVKPVDRLLAAYDDQAGVTAAFNLNLLARINRELGGDFDPRRFTHVARYEARARRVEMLLRSRVRQTVTVRAAGIAVELARGETILTEVSYKFRPEQLATMAHAAGFRMEAQWVDAEWPFAENLMLAEA